MRSDTEVPESVATRPDIKAPWVFIWNDPLERRCWMPYLPPTSSIVNAEHLWALVRGEISIFVVIDMIALEEIVTELGFEGRFDPEEPSHPLLIRIESDAGAMWISEEMLGRVGMECVSPRWLIKNCIETFRRATSDIPKVLEGDLASHGLQMLDQESKQELIKMDMPENIEVVVRGLG